LVVVFFQTFQKSVRDELEPYQLGAVHVVLRDGFYRLHDDDDDDDDDDLSLLWVFLLF
jgi:hypothetical protein